MAIDFGQSIWAEVRQLCSKSDEDLVAYTRLLLLLSKSDVEVDRVVEAFDQVVSAIDRWSDGIIARLSEAVGELVDLEGAE